MAAPPQAPHKAVDGQRYAVNFWRVSLGDIGKAHGLVTASNIDAYDTPVAGTRADAAAVRPRQGVKVRSLASKSGLFVRSVRPLVQTATDQDAKAARDRIGPAINRDTVRMVGRLAAHLVGQRYE